jgi:hypothetical protein
MRRIADDCNAKAGSEGRSWKLVEASFLSCLLRESRQVRLRGIGSGFLEGSDGTEAHSES